MGVRIIIHNSSVNPFSFEGFEAMAGVETNIAINRVFSSKKEYPYSDCIRDTKNHASYLKNENFTTDPQYLYRRIDCIFLCRENYVFKSIGCNYPNFQKKQYSKICLSIHEIYNLLNIYSKIFTHEINELCKQECPLECDSVQYNFFSSQAYFPGPQYLKEIGLKNSVIENYRKSNLALNIYYDSLFYTKIDEVAKIELIDLIPNIGGTLGLFLGISLLSFVEIFEFIFLITAYFFET